METQENELFGENTSSGHTAKDFILKYLSYWPLFLTMMGICVGLGILYTRYATPKYLVSTLILVKDDQSAKANSQDDLIRLALNGEKKNNLDNELQLIRSSDLMDQVVTKNGFNISYYKLGNVRKIDLYLDATFRLIPQVIADSTRSVNIILKHINSEGAAIQFGKDNSKGNFFKWNTSFKINGNEFVLVPKGKSFDEEGTYLASWNPVSVAADEISGKFKVDELDKKTSIIQLSMLTENLERGKDILNAICKEFYRADIEEKNIVSQNTLQFIDDRLDLISKELSGVEGNLENYQGANQIINVASQSTQSFENANNISKNLNDINIQQGVVSMIQSYFNNPNNQAKLVPSSLGISDPTLTLLIEKYNELQLKKEREAPLLAPKSIELRDLNNQINDIKGSILENLQNITKNLKLQESSLEARNSQYKEFLSALPHKERVMQEIKRKQSVTEGLYLYLLQKREEFAISASSSNISLYKQIDNAKGIGPVEPNNKNIYMLSALLGLLLPVGFISLRDLLNDKISTKSDITSRAHLPLIGELGHVPRNKDKKVSLSERDGLGEQFRVIRTNLSFFQKNKSKQVYLITSSAMNEGKSFVSLNLAMVMAIPGKKVALLEFDIRKPRISKNLELSNNRGITNYLTGQTNELCKLFQVLENIPTLHIYSSGPIPPNPGDLLLTEKVPMMFEYLRTHYDYLIIDSPPVGLVSDAYILSEYSDAVMYVIRQRHTLKKQIDFVAEIANTKKLNNMCLLVNDVKTGGKYGNGYSSVLDYNYSYGENAKKSLWKKLMPA